MVRKTKKSTWGFEAGTKISLDRFYPYGLLVERMIKTCFENREMDGCDSCTVKALGFDDICQTLKKRIRQESTVD